LATKERKIVKAWRKFGNEVIHTRMKDLRLFKVWLRRGLPSGMKYCNGLQVGLFQKIGILMIFINVTFHQIYFSSDKCEDYEMIVVCARGDKKYMHYFCRVFISRMS
jgi:hypothetical protein